MPRARLPLLLLFLVGAVHAPAWFGEFVYDDRLVIVGNAALQRSDLGALLTEPYFAAGQSYWRPLTSLALWLGNAFGGAFGIHAIAWCAHLGASFFAWRIAASLLSDPRRAFFAALLFGIHPVQVEGVAWCSAINDPLFWCFGLASVDAALRAKDGRTLVCLLLALLAKENTLALLPVVAIARWRTTTSRHRAVAAMAGIAVLWWLLRSVVLGDLAGGMSRAAVDATVAANRFAGAIELFGRELELLVWPWPQSPFRPLALDGATVARAAAWMLAWCGALAFSWWRGRRTAFFALLLLGAQPLLCAICCDRLGGYPVADRYLGPSVLGASLLLFALPAARTLTAVGTLLCAAAGVAAMLHTPTFRDQTRFVEHALVVANHDAAVQCMAGSLALEAGDVASATSRFEAAVAATANGTNTASGSIHRAAVDARIGLGWCALRTSPPSTARARARFTEAIGLDENAATAWIGLGVVHGSSGDVRAAEQALRRATAIAPDNSQAHYNLAFLLAQTGRTTDARASAAEALRCDPHNAPARQLLDGLR